MLKHLSIKNFALIEDAEIDLGPGLNIITGETGAGKSIVLGALSMILGERASTDFIRTGCDRAIIEGVFTAPVGWTLPGGVGSDGEMIVRRELSVKGQSRCFVNDGLVTVAELKQMGDALVDLHGQHEHQYLLRQDVHIDMLDDYAASHEAIDGISILYRDASALEEAITRHQTGKKEYEEKKDHYLFLLREIEDISPSDSEDEQLLEEERILGSSEKLHALTNRIYGELYESDSAILDRLKSFENELQALAAIDRRFDEWLQQFRTALITLEEVSRGVGDYRHRITFDPDRLNQIRERLMAIQRLKKKYGSIEDILKKRDEYREFVRMADNFDNEIQARQEQVRKIWKQYDERAKKLSELRKTSAERLEKAVVKELANLGMSDARFEVQIDRTDKPTAKGIDRVNFLLSANPGEPPKELVKVASGGEVSRIMLAIKASLAESDRIPTLVFDEIDVGISGRIASAVGKVLSDLSNSHQIICITHLPQIASMPATHFAVSKKVENDLTTTKIKVLDAEGKVLEVAKLLGGDTVTSLALENARELVTAAK
jgi:DNA repair protein RecN (Recombination protein N)